MKKIALMVFGVLIVLGLGAKSAPAVQSDYLRYLEYYRNQLIHLQEVGGTYQGTIYEALSPNESPREVKEQNFVAPIENGLAEAEVGLDPGTYSGYAEWQESVHRDELFVSQSVMPTMLASGAQAMPFVMSLAQSGIVRFNLPGTPVSDREPVWFAGNQAYWNGNDWQAYVNQPWNLVGENVQVIVGDRGGWTIPITMDSFNGVPIDLASGDMDHSLTAPTTVDLPTLTDQDNLEGGWLDFVREGYEDVQGRVLVFESHFAQPITKVVVQFQGYDAWFNQTIVYRTAVLSNMSGTFVVPLENEWLRPDTIIHVYLVDPRDGSWTQTYFWDLYQNNDGGGKG